jgi:hypothetical protein
MMESPVIQMITSFSRSLLDCSHVWGFISCDSLAEFKITTILYIIWFFLILLAP